MSERVGAGSSTSYKKLGHLLLPQQPPVYVYVSTCGNARRIGVELLLQFLWKKGRAVGAVALVVTSGTMPSSHSSRGVTIEAPTASYAITGQLGSLLLTTSGPLMSASIGWNQ